MGKEDCILKALFIPVVPLDMPECKKERQHRQNYEHIDVKVVIEVLSFSNLCRSN